MAKRVIKHKPTATGIAVGRAFCLSREPAPVPKYWITDKELAGEILRFRRALQRSKRQLTAIKEKLCRFQGREQIQILESHLLLVQDATLVDRTIQQIAGQKINAEWAVEKAVEHFKLGFLNVRESYFQERLSDIDYVHQRLLKNLLGSAEPDLRKIPYAEAVLVANDLSPAEVAALPRQRVKGFLTAIGGHTSHTAIIARSLEIPAMVGVDQILRQVREGDTVILDGLAGRILIRPTIREIAAYRRKQKRHEREQRGLLEEGRLPAVTRDGHQITLAANIELVEEIASAIEHGAEGIGMYRTEYLYLNRSDLPSEEEHFENYRRAAEAVAPRPLTIRTLDLGGDKILTQAEYQEHANPALGLRAIRFCLREPDLFRAQLRAIYRASAHGNVRILFPLITTVEEAHQVIALTEAVREELKRQRRSFRPQVPLGAMIEVPSAALMAGHLAQLFQFLSIGTNDLTQYSLAVDRTNEHVAYLFHSLHPAVLSLIHQTVQAGKAAGIPVTVCGEMAAEPTAVLALLGLEVDCLSMNPISIPRVKRLLRTAVLSEAKAFVTQALAAATLAQVEALTQQAMEALANTP